MPTNPSPSTSHSNFASLFNAALESYNRKTKTDLASNPLLPSLQSCDSPEAILIVLREQIPAFNKSQNSDDGLTKWVVPTVNVLYSFSATVGGVVGIAFPPANIIFTGIGVLLLAANDASASKGKLIDLLNRIEHFFRRLEIYTGITPTMGMRDVIIEIMVEVLGILAIATKEVKRGRLKKYMKKLIGNTEIEDSLNRLDRLTQEEARMASAELLKATNSVHNKVIGIDDRAMGVERKVQDVHSDLQDVGSKVQVIEGEVQEVRSDVQDVGNNIQGVEETVQDVRGNVQDVGNKVQGVDDRVQGIGNDIKDISSEVRGVNDKLDQVTRNQLKDNLLRWLSPPDPSINHNIASKAHHDGTAQWFFQGSIFNEWKSTDSFLWIHGKPGAGKSVMCSSIIEDIIALSNAGEASVAYFYFDFRDVDKQKLHNLLTSLLIQLSARSDPCGDILSQLHSSCDRGVRKPSDRAMVECLKEMLSVEAHGPTYIIMDALDECPITSTIPSPREEVLDLVDELVGLHLPNVHICVTSRPELDIQAVLGCLTQQPISLHNETGQKRDIADYVASFVHSDRRMGRWREGDKDLVIKTLLEKSDGMFRWAFCQLEALRHCFPPSVRRILEELPESLDETYERILREIKKPNQELAFQLLKCLVAAVRPLRVEELAEVLAFDFNTEGIPKLNPNWRWEDQEEAVMSACSSLVVIVNDGNSRIVQFSHFSVKEFLTARRLAEPMRDVSRYHIRLEAAHTILAQACLGVLLRLDDRVDRDNVKNFPLALYATECWAMHARFGNVLSWIKDGMECLFDADKPHFAAWLRLRPGHSMSTMSTMCPEKPEAVSLYYAARFGFRDIAEHLVAKHPEHVHARCMFETPMHVAAYNGHVDILSVLLNHGADVDVGEMDGRTPLHRASLSGQLEAGRFLLDHGANIDPQGDNSHSSWTPLTQAAAWGRLEFARMLIERGAVIDALNIDSETPLNLAVNHENIQIIRLLLEYGADVNFCTKLIGAPLHEAASKGNIQAMQLLLEHGADVNLRDRSAYAPLHYAARFGKIQAMQLLLEHGADVNLGGRSGSPLQEAAIYGKTPAMRLLLEHGADVNLADESGRTSLYWAAVQTVNFRRDLLLFGPDVDLGDESGKTPPHWPARRGYIRAMRLLLEHGADVNVLNELGDILSLLALTPVRPEIVELLTEYRALHIIRPELMGSGKSDRRRLTWPYLPESMDVGDSNHRRLTWIW